MKVTMKYNPYKVETQLYVDNENLMDSTKFSAYKNERLQVWIEILFPMLVDEINDDIFDFEFIGTMPDFEDIQLYSSFYPNVTLTHIQVEEIDDKFSSLEELVQMMKVGPFEQLRDERIEHNFQKALNSEFEIAVIATMSSGKSTLINAILGQELMPSKNEACTAKVSRIKNNPNITNYSAIAYDKNGEVFKTITNASVEDFTAFNDDREIHLIEIEGNIPTIKSGKMNLVLVDTPGPNNSMDASHRQHTLSVIKSDDKPMVLYVLNATQLRTDDDLALLNIVAEAMAVGGKQSKDRFIFAMNKADAFDPEKGESIAGAIENVRDYLEQQNIENPNIYPVSSQVAKVIRKQQNGLKLTRSEKADLINVDLFIEEPSMHLNQYAPISPSLNRAIEEAVENTRDEHIQALHYTGITSIEAAINEYLEKYAVTSKITNAVNTFQRIVEQEDMQNKLEHAILEDSQQREEIKMIMESINAELEKGDKAAEFKSKIENMDVNMSNFFSDVNKKTFKKLTDIPNKLKGKVKKFEAERILSKVQSDVLMLQDELVTDLEKNISLALRQKAESYVSEYQSYIEGITSFESNSIKLSNWNKAFTSGEINVENLIDRYSTNERIVVGTRTVSNSDRKWYTFWRPKYVEENVYEDIEFVDLEAIGINTMDPIEDAIEKNIKDAVQFTESELKKLKQFFISEISRLEKIMQARINEIKDLASETENLDEQLREHYVKREWLEAFIYKLDNVLELKEKEVAFCE
ncbi:dynamin family protein [Lysinibacillus sp. IITD104]|uniref:dynamin family protein n=1 Tax=Lysinibacillus sp. IITD104 TaxID=3116650 RepID=UPI002FD54990